MTDANHNQPGLNPSNPEYVQSVFALQMDSIDPALTAGQSNTPLQPTAQPSPPRSFPSNMAQIQNPSSHSTFPSSNPAYHPDLMAAQNNPNMSALGNGNGMAPAQGQDFNAQSTSVGFQNPTHSSAGQSVAATQANLHNNMANMAAQQATQQHQPPLNGYVGHNLGGNNFMRFPQQTQAPAAMQYEHHQQPISGMANQYLPVDQIPSSFDFSLIPGAASHYNNGGFHNNNNNNSSFRPNSMSTLLPQSPRPSATSLPTDALSRAAENMNSQVAAETAKNGASKRATSQTPTNPQEANPAQPQKRKRSYAPRKPKGDGTADPTAPKEPPKKRPRTQKKKPETTAPVASMAAMSTAMSTPTFTPALLPTTNQYATTGSATVSSSVPPSQMSQPSSQPPIFNMAPPPPTQVPSEFTMAANSTPIPALNSAPPTHAVKQTPAKGVQDKAPAVPTKVSPVPIPNIPTVPKVPSVFPRQAPGTTPSPPTAPASTQTMAPGPARSQAPAPTPAPTPAHTPARVSPQHAPQPPTQSAVGLSAQRAPNAAFTPSPSPAPARSPPQSSTQGQTQLPAQVPVQPSTHVTTQPIGQQQPQASAQQPIQHAVQQQPQHALQQPNQHAAQYPAQQSAQQQAYQQAQLQALQQAQDAVQSTVQHAVQNPAQHVVQQITQNTAQQQAHHTAHQQAQQQALQRAYHAAQQQAQKKAQEQAQQKAREDSQKEAQEKAQEQAKKQALQQAQRAAQLASAPPIPNFIPSPLSKTVTPTIISLQADTELYCVFGPQTLHHFRVCRSTLKHLHHTSSLKTTSPFPNVVYINFDEALTTTGATPIELDNLPGETADSHMQAFGRLLLLLENPATQGKISCDVETIWRLANLQPALGLDKVYVGWLRRCMAVFMSQVTTVPDSTGGKGSVNSHWMSQAVSEDMFGDRDMKGADLKKNKWEKALEACRKWTWVVEWRTLCARLAYLCAVDNDAQGRLVLKKPGDGVVLNRMLVGEETIDAIVNARTQACRYLISVAETTCKNWQGRIKNGQRNGGCRSKVCMDKRTGGLVAVVRGLGLYIPKETTTTTTAGPKGPNGSNPETQAASIEPTFHGQATKMTNGLSIHSVFDVLKAIEREQRGQYHFADAILRQFGGKCYECMKGSAFGPGEHNPTNPLFPVIDLLYEMLWDLRIKLLEWTEFPWAEKIVLEGIE
ncbi:hypothetical protein QBC32DRAFT_232182, partial [Pseudoneurospora amorphoporcata]